MYSSTTVQVQEYLKYVKYYCRMEPVSVVLFSINKQLQLLFLKYYIKEGISAVTGSWYCINNTQNS